MLSAACAPTKSRASATGASPPYPYINYENNKPFCVGNTSQSGFLFLFSAQAARKGVIILGKSPLNYTGNKACIALYLLDIMPPHSMYIEAFCGSMEILLCKEPCEREIANDYSSDVMNFWRVVRSDKLAQLIGWIFLSVNTHWAGAHPACFFMRNLLLQPEHEQRHSEVHVARHFFKTRFQVEAVARFVSDFAIARKGVAVDRRAEYAAGLTA